MICSWKENGRREKTKVRKFTEKNLDYIEFDGSNTSEKMLALGKKSLEKSAVLKKQLEKHFWSQ